MKKQDEYTDENPRVRQEHCSASDFDDEMQLTAEDSSLLEKINSYFKGYYDIKDAISDPAYSKTGDTVKLMISEYQNSADHNIEIEKFIREGTTVETPEEKTKKEITQIKQEIRDSNLNDISARWVEEWSGRKGKEIVRNKKTEDIREFIARSLEPEKSITEINRRTKREKSGSGRIRIISYISLAAAVIAGTVLIIRSLLPLSDPDKIFSKYFEPYSAVSFITRSTGNGAHNIFTSALQNYREGDYRVAAAGFSEAMYVDSVSDSPRFFLGITLISLNDFNRAVSLLDEVVAGQGEFIKEARWYLGLASLKTGNKAKASECFEMLAQTPGFYSKWSENILRRLK